MSAAETAITNASKLAPHFSVVSLVPAAVLITSISFVAGAEPWTGHPEWGQSFGSLTSPSFSQLAFGVITVVVVALALHPLQFPLIQLLEGYWGQSRPALRLASLRLEHHREILESLETTAEGSDAAMPNVDAAWRAAEAARLRVRYPHEPDDVRPTRLGNVLRRYERAAGNPYALDLVTTAPILQLVAEEDDLAYVRDQRTQLDLATAMCAVSALVAVGYTVLLLPTGWWLLIAAVPYTLAYAFYRGSCSVAEEYGTALTALMDLNRTAMYQRLRIHPGMSLSEERQRNPALMRILGDRSNAEDLPLTEPIPPQSSHSPGAADRPASD